MSNFRFDKRKDRLVLSQGGPCCTEILTINKRKKFIIENIQIDNKLKILEIGCGKGVYLNLLSHYASYLVGIDINAAYLAEAGKKDSIAVLELMSAEDLKFKDACFDAVVIIEVLEHLPFDRKAISEISRVLKPGGILILTAPNKWFPFETHGIRIGRIQMRFPFTAMFPFSPLYPLRLRNIMANARVYSYSQLKNLLIENGFLVNRISYLTPCLDSFQNRSGLLNKLLTRVSRKGFELLEKYSISLFSPTLIVSAVKTGGKC
jgi:SAM-dependent methyltransferase